jgi:hypothetical protein
MAQKTASTSKRILTFDLLRGFFLLTIILNHLQWYPNLFEWATYRGTLFVSAAEGFFLISGIVLGIVRGRKLLEKPFAVAAKLLLVRGVQLYVISIILMLAFTFIGWLFIGNPGLKPGIRPTDEPLFDIIFGALSFNYIYGWADFLRLYAIFLFMSPLALWLLRIGKWYVVLIASAALWALYPYALATTGHSAEILMVLSWQFVFFIGLVVGFHWQHLTNWWSRISQHRRRWLLTPILVIASVTVIANIILACLDTLGIAPELSRSIQASLAGTFNKEALTLPRLLLFGTWFVLGFYLFHRYERFILRWFGWILLPFGANSLYVYIMHAIILFFAHLIMAPGASENILLNTVGSLAIVGLILLAVYRKFLFKIIPR